MSELEGAEREDEKAHPDGAGEEGNGARPCVLSGEIRAAGMLFDIISFLAHASWWGELVVADGDTMRSLFFDEGHVVGAESNATSERLGEVLRREGVLTDEQAEASRARAAERNLRFGEAVIDLGFMKREALFELMPRQVDDIVGGMGGMESGQFVFLEGFDDRDLAFRQKRSADGLLLDALRRMDEKRHFKSCIPSDAHVPVRTINVPPPNEDPFGVYEAIDGKRSVAEVAASIGLDEIDVTRALAHHVLTGHAAIKPPRPAVSKMIEIYNEAIKVLLHEVDLLGVGDEVRTQLAGFAAHESTKSFFASPKVDGTLDGGAVVDRIAGASDPQRVEEQLGQWLYDYASYAIFLARPHLDRPSASQGPPGAAVSRRVADLLAPIRPAGEPTVAPPEGPAVDAARGTTTRQTLRVGSAAVATQRMRKCAPALVPGVDPARTLLIRAFAGAPSASGARARTPAPLQAPGGRPRVMHQAFVLPPGHAAHARDLSEARPATPSLRAPVVALVAVSSLILGLLVGAALYRANGAGALPAPASSSAAANVPR